MEETTKNDENTGLVQVKKGWLSDEVEQDPLDYEQVIQRIEQFRKEHAGSKADFLTRLGVQPQTYNNYLFPYMKRTGKAEKLPGGKRREPKALSGRPSKVSLDLVHRLAVAYGIDPMWLMTGKGYKQLITHAVQADKSNPLGGLREQEANLSHVFSEAQQAIDRIKYSVNALYDLMLELTVHMRTQREAEESLAEAEHHLEPPSLPEGG